ncbi:MAG: hypothetical protein NTX97_01530 [Bacteroidetes bacterium]|nr:hypothetical protein [Bacteroidota bacterium]
MKRFFFLPKLSVLSMALLLTAGVTIFSEMGCAPKPACGTRRDHRIRKKRVHKFAPSMGMNSKPSINYYVSK